MTNLNDLITYFKYQNGLKHVFRSIQDQNGRRESSAEHSWSVAMMVWFLTKPIEEELGVKLDQNRLMKMALIHDIVEIEAGDVDAWDKKGRVEVADKEVVAIENINSTFAVAKTEGLQELWLEHENRETIEAKLVKACDQLCPLIYRLTFNCDYKGAGVTREKLDEMFLKIVSFSQTTLGLYLELAGEVGARNFFDV